LARSGGGEGRRAGRGEGELARWLSLTSGQHRVKIGQ
jgi:hypothetical protein